MKPENITKILSQTINCHSKWELDEIVYNDRMTNPVTMRQFLERIEFLRKKRLKVTESEKIELKYLTELLSEITESECKEVLALSEEQKKHQFIESLARKCAIEVLTEGKWQFETMNTACKLSPNDFILLAKRAQDLINAIRGLVIKGENLSKDVAGA